jgi:NAD(P)-dependent dehydrogenase (short-subunit alcohol dehydrogenase family)
MSEIDPADRGAVIVIGGTAGIGREIAKHYADQGRDVVLTGRDADRCAKIAAEVGGNTSSVAVDLSRPETIGAALADTGPVEHLVLAAIERDNNTAADFNIAGASYLVTLKLVGYVEVVHQLLPKMTPSSSIVVFGGQAKERPYPGAVTVATVNGGVVGMVTALAVELKPIRVNAIHPGIVGDSPFWRDRPAEVLEGFRSRTPTGRLATMRDVVSAVEFLLENESVNGQHLAVDGGWLLQ